MIGTCHAIRGILYSVRYIILWTNWWHYNFSQFEDRNLVENELNVEEDELISAPIDESSTYDDSDAGSISTNALNCIRDGSKIHPDINTRDVRLKTRYHIKQIKVNGK